MNGAPPGRIHPDHEAEKRMREDFPSLKKDLRNAMYADGYCSRVSKKLFADFPGIRQTV